MAHGISEMDLTYVSGELETQFNRLIKRAIAEHDAEFAAGYMKAILEASRIIEYELFDNDLQIKIKIDQG